MKDMVKVSGLRKQYGAHLVLDEVSFTVRQGEIFGVIGVNGAGKTTLLECIEGLRQRDGGQIELTGRVGIQLQDAALPAHIRVKEALALIARWKKTEWKDADDPELIRLYPQLYHHLSTGQKRKVQLAAALIADPDIVFLDEPGAGLDVSGRLSLHQQIRQLARRGKSVIIASHDMAEVEALCARILVLQRGKVSFLGTLEELAERTGKHYVIHLVTERTEREVISDQIAATLQALLRAHQGENIVDLRVSRGSLAQHLLALSEESA